MPGWSPRPAALRPRAALLGAAGRTPGLPAPQILASPPGSVAPVHAINYTPATGEIHHPGALAPVHELNYSLLPGGPGAGGGFSEGAGMTGGGMGAGAAYGTAPPGQPSPRYPSSPSTLRNTFSAGQPPLSPSPYGMGPAPRTPVSGPGPRPFSERSSMRGSLGAGADGQTSGSAQTTTGVDPTQPPGVAPQVDASVSAVEQVSSDAAVDKGTGDGKPPPIPGWHSEGDPNVPPGWKGENVLWWVNGDRTKFIYVGSIQKMPDGSYQLIKPPDRETRAAMSYQLAPDGSHQTLPEFVQAAKAPKTIKVVDNTAGSPTYGRYVYKQWNPQTGNYDQTIAEAGVLPGATNSKSELGPDGLYHDWQFDPVTQTYPHDKAHDLGPSKTQPKGTSATTGTSSSGAAIGDRQVVGDTVLVVKQDPGGRLYWDVDPTATARQQTQPQFNAGGTYIPPGGQLDVNYGPAIGTVHYATQGATAAAAPTATSPSTAQPLAKAGVAGTEADPTLGGALPPIPLTTPGGQTTQVGGTLPSGTAGVAGQDPRLTGQAQPPTKVTRASGETETVEPGAGQDTFMGRGLTPQTGRGSTGIGWNVSGRRGWFPGAGHGPSGGGTRGGMGGSGIGGGGGVGQDQDPNYPTGQDPNYPMPPSAGPASTPPNVPPYQPPPPTPPLGRGEWWQQALPPPGGWIRDDQLPPGIPNVIDVMIAQDRLGQQVGQVPGNIQRGASALGARAGDALSATTQGGNVMSALSGQELAFKPSAQLDPSQVEDVRGRQMRTEDMNTPWRVPAGANPKAAGAGQAPDQAGPGPGPEGAAAPQPGASPSPTPGWTPPLSPQDVQGIGHRFGQQMNVGEPQHSGVDLQAAEGTSTVSPVDGLVERIEHNPQGLGLTVIIRGKDGSEHRLGHLSHTDAYPGMQVAQGQDLQSKVGSSGNTTGSHLHWGVKDPQGNPVDNTGALGPMQNMPPVPGTQMMGPPGGNGGAAQAGAPPGMGAGLGRLSMGSPGVGGETNFWQPKQIGAGQSPLDWHNAGYSIEDQSPNLGMRTGRISPTGGWNQPNTLGLQDTPASLPRMGPVDIDPMQAFGAGQEAPRAGWNPGVRSSWIVRPPIGVGQDTSSQDYQAGYQAGLQASKNPGTPPIFVPAMQQPVPTASDQQQGAGQEYGPSQTVPYDYLVERQNQPTHSGAAETGYSGGWTGSMMGRPWEGGTRPFDPLKDITPGAMGTGQATGTTGSVPDPGVTTHLGGANPSTGTDPTGVQTYTIQFAPTPEYPNGYTLTLTQPEIVAQLQAATDWDPSKGDAVTVFKALASGGTAPGVKVTVPEAAPTLTDVPKQTGPGLNVPTADELAKEYNAIQTKLMDEAQSIFEKYGTDVYNAWKEQNTNRLQLIRDVLSNPYQQLVSGMAPGPGEQVGVSSNMQSMISDLSKPFQSAFAGAQPAGAPYTNWTAPGSPANQAAATTTGTTPSTTTQPTGALLTAGQAGVAGQDPSLAGWDPSGQPIQIPQASSQSNIPEGTARTRTLPGAGQAQISTAALNAAGYADTPEGRAQYAAGQPPSGNGAVGARQMQQGYLTATGAAPTTPDINQQFPGWNTWQGWDPLNRNAYLENQLLAQGKGGPAWATVRGNLLNMWTGQGGTPDVTQMQYAAAGPKGQVGQALTGEVYGYKDPQQWQSTEQQQWSRAKAPTVRQNVGSSQNLSGIAAA